MAANEDVEGLVGGWCGVPSSLSSSISSLSSHSLFAPFLTQALSSRLPITVLYDLQYLSSYLDIIDLLLHAFRVYVTCNY